MLPQVLNSTPNMLEPSSLNTKSGGVKTMYGLVIGMELPTLAQFVLLEFCTKVMLRFKMIAFY